MLTWCCGAAGLPSSQTASSALCWWVPAAAGALQTWCSTQQCLPPCRLLPAGSPHTPLTLLATAAADAAAGPLERPSRPQAFLLRGAGEWRAGWSAGTRWLCHALACCSCCRCCGGAGVAAAAIPVSQSLAPPAPAPPISEPMQACACIPLSIVLLHLTSGLPLLWYYVVQASTAQWGPVGATVAAARLPSCMPPRPAPSAAMLPTFASLPATHPPAPFT